MIWYGMGMDGSDSDGCRSESRFKWMKRAPNSGRRRDVFGFSAWQRGNQSRELTKIF